MPGWVKWTLRGLGALAMIVLAFFAFTKKLTNVSEDDLPPFIQANVIDPKLVASVSKFRSGAGHSNPGWPETCRSMKHYVNTYDPNRPFIIDTRKLDRTQTPSSEYALDIISPVDGRLTKSDTGEGDDQLNISVDGHRGFSIRFEHVHLDPGIRSFSAKVKAGQKIATVWNGQNFDLSVFYHYWRGDKLFSYFQVLPDDLFAAWQAQGATRRDDFIFTRDYRDAHPLECLNDRRGTPSFAGPDGQPTENWTDENFVRLATGKIQFQKEQKEKATSKGANAFPWPMYRGNTKHTGLSPYDTSRVDGTVLWKFKTEGAIETAPVVGADGTMYVGSWDGNVYAINPNGTEKWRYAVGGLVRSSSGLGFDGTVYVMATFDPKPSRFNPEYTEGAGKLYAINADGTKKWEYETGGIIDGIGPPVTVGADGTIYVGGASVDHPDRPGKAWFYAFNPDGTVKWQITERLGAVYTAPAIDDKGTLYFGSTDGFLFSYDAQGNKQWTFSTGGPIASSPAIGKDGTIYFGSNDNRYEYTNKGLTPPPGTQWGKLWAVTPDGTEKWHVTFDDWAEASPAIASDGTIYIGANDKSLLAPTTNHSTPSRRKELRNGNLQLAES